MTLCTDLVSSQITIDKDNAILCLALENLRWAKVVRTLMGMVLAPVGDQTPVYSMEGRSVTGYTNPTTETNEFPERESNPGRSNEIQLNPGL